jgi:predicted nucleic acid-binding protein
MIALLDTNILIASRGSGETPPDLAGFEDLRVSSLSLAELVKGLNTAPDIATYRSRSERLAWARTTFGDGIPFDDRCMEAYQRLLAAVTVKGLSARPHMLDRMLAATALAHGMTLVSRDLRVFSDLTDHVRIERR